MGGLPEQKLAILRQMVESAPDRVVGDLRGALSGAAGDSGLAAVRLLVETEARDRQLRNAVLYPIAPLCVGDGRTERLTFPSRALTLVWRGLRDQATHEVARAAALAEEFQADQSSPEPFDILARRAARGLSERNHPKFIAAAEAADAARPGGALLLAECMQMVPIVRAAVGRLPSWIQRVTEDDAAVARLAYKDSVAIAEDAGPRFFEMLAAHLTHPWMVLRLISAVMDKPSEAYLAGSELASFGHRVLDGVDAGLADLDRFDIHGGMPAVRTAVRAIESVNAQIAEIEGNVELNRQGIWGARVGKQKATLARLVEGRLRLIDKALAQALPLTEVWSGRVSRQVARLTSPLDAAALQTAKTLVAFAQEIRGAANTGGFAAARAEVMKALEAHIDLFTDDALECLRKGEAAEPEIARALLNAAIELTALARDRQAADILRRRLAAI